MSKKIEKQLAIDVTRGVSGAPGEALTSTASTLGPALPVPPAPTDVTIGTMTIGRSSASAVAIVPVTWRPPGGTAVASYLIEVATDSGFTSIVQRSVASGPSAALELPTSKTFWLRVYARYGAQTSSPSVAVSFTTPADLTPAGVPTSAAAAFIGAGDLQITWTNPTDENLRDVEVKIWASSAKTTLLHTAYEASGRYVWTAAQNRDAGSGTPDPSVYVEIKSRTWSLVLGTAVVVGTITKAVPATPTGLASDFTGTDCIVSWNAVTDAAFYQLTLDSAVKVVYGTRFVYTFDQNRVDHSGTPDPVLSLSLVAVDALSQSSTAATGTATNAAPSAPSSVAIAGGFTTIGVIVTATPPADFALYRYRIIQTNPSAADVTIDDSAALLTRTLTANATYQVGVKIVDVFGQASSETLSSTAVIDALTLADLREGTRYSDSLGTAAATLKAALADDVRSSGGVSYALNASWVRWIRAERDLLDRYRTLTISMTPASGTTNWYVRTSKDGSTWSYFSGPAVANGAAGSNKLTSVADATAAQTAALSAASLGGPTTSRVDLPSITEARYVELWLRNTAAATRVDEFYPRRLVQSDDLEAESIKALNIAAAAITADRLNVTQLSAITADMGAITAGTVTGATIRTAASGARIELTSPNGLRSYNSSNVLQVQIRTSDGALTWGGGNGVLDAAGIRLVTSTSSTVDATRALTLQMPSAAVASLTGYETAGRSVMQSTMIAAGSGRSADYEIIMRAQAGSPQAGITISAPWAPGGTPTITLDGYVQGMNVQGTVDIAGSLQASADSAIGTTAAAGNRLIVQGGGNTSATYALSVKNSVGTSLMYTRNDGALNASIVNWTITSDERAKRQIADLDVAAGDVAGLLQALRPRRYRLALDAADAPERLGFIAQEWQAHPLLATQVRTLEDGTLGIIYDGALPILATLLRRAFARIAALEARAA